MLLTINEWKKMNENSKEQSIMTIKFTKNDINKMVLDSDFYFISDSNKYIVKLDDIDIGIWDRENEKLTIKNDILKKWLVKNSFMKKT